MKVKFAKYSICICGFQILNDNVPIGTVFEIDPAKKQPVTFICGGCRSVLLGVPCVWVEDRGNSRAGYMPEEIFEPL